MANITTVKDLATEVDATALLTRPLSDWRPALADECQVYVFGENYLAKRFDQIHYKFCDKLQAKEILVDNLYALLRYKYFPKSSDEIDDRINKIVNSFTANLKTSLKKVSFDEAADCEVMHQLPDYCLAFRNGVYDFKNNKWLFKYNIVELKRISNKIYIYDPTVAVMWYFDYNFEPLPLDITKTSLQEFVEFMKSITKEPGQRNYCFELLYNMCHASDDSYSPERFTHLCEILGYSVLQSFSQYFVMFIGSGQNGKNSLFDGCFIHRIIPRPAANDLDSIESDRFITGSLENKAQNIFLETSAKTYVESKMIKALTGSMYQTIESKGISKYSSIINCKYIFAGNSKDKLKFSDNTVGFRRRINMYEIFFRWDSDKHFMKHGDYYDTTFSDSLVELAPVSNTTTYVYFAMYGIMSATKGFNSNFKFTYNDWQEKYMEVDEELKEKLQDINIDHFVKYFSNPKNKSELRSAFYTPERERLYLSKEMKTLGYTTPDKLLKLFEDEEAYTSFFAEHDVYISMKVLQGIVGDLHSSVTFNQAVKKIYSIANFENIYNNKAYCKINFKGKKLVILK